MGCTGAMAEMARGTGRRRKSGAGAGVVIAGIDTSSQCTPAVIHWLEPEQQHKHPEPY